MTKNPINNNFNNSEIAIIAVAGRFPGAKDIESFWRNLRDGVESISWQTDEELINSGVSPDLLSHPNYVKASGVLEDIELFDANFFAYSAKEAELIDPQQRLFLELASEAIEKAGYDPQTYNGLIGVYGGVGMNRYFLQNLYSNNQLLERVDPVQLAISSDKDFLPTRVAYKLNLTGTAVNVQTACSTSLVAVHLACQSLLNCECDMALAGGVTLSIPQKVGYLHQEGMILSPDGHCRAFDAQAQGTIAGSGAGIVVLKRLQDAIGDRDHIHAIIKGSASNNDGAMKVGYTAPSINGQAAVISEAQTLAGVDAETISYIEAHGTATPLGDPIEIAALTQAFSQTTDKKGFCAIGSVKTNLGHLDTAAGVAGLIKTVLALQHKMLPPSLHFETPNPKIDFANSPFYVNTTLKEWKTDNTPRRAGVSSFGMGGTNAHVILEETPVLEQRGRGAEGSQCVGRLCRLEATGVQRRNYQLLCLSAKTMSALEKATANLVTHLKEYPELNLGDVAYTLNSGRRGFNYRRMLVCRDLEDAVKGLESKQVFSNYTEITERPVVFMFPGQGSQYVNMAREIYETEAVFKEQVDYCSEFLKPILGLDLRHILYPSDEKIDEASRQLQQTRVAQPAIFVIEYALAKLWQSWGVEPQAAIGHSIGEYVAATLAEVFSLEDALSLVAARGQMMQQLPTGAMLSIPLSADKIQPLLRQELSVAAINQSSQCVVSGSIAAIDALQNQLAAQDIESRRLHTSHAFHSQMMEPILEAFREQVKKVTLNPPKLPYISNLTGNWITVIQATNPDYYAQHLRSTVLFASGIEKLLAKPEQVLLEVGPGHTLTTLTKRHPDKAATQIVLTSVRHPQEKQSDIHVLFNTFGQLWLAGVKVDWFGFYSQDEYYHIPLPTYPFERQRYWIDPPQKTAWENSQIPPTSQLWTLLTQAGQKQASVRNAELDELTYQVNKQWLDNLCIAYINSAFQQLGAFSNPQDKHSLENLLQKYNISPRYEQLFSRFLQILVEQKQLQQQEGLFTRLVPCSQDYINAHLEQVRTRFANSSLIDLDLIQSCGENLAAIVVGEQEPLEIFNELVYQKENKPAYSESALITYYNSIVRSSLEQLIKSLPSSVQLRVLEIGAGTGVTTQSLLPVLPTQQTSYTFTDIGSGFLTQAQKKFQEYPFVEYRLLDIDKPPTEQGFEKYSYDVIIATNVLHATRNIDKTLHHVRSLLAPGGFLLIWEITQPKIDFDISWGLLLKPLDDRRRSPGQPFIILNQWFEVLHEQDFMQVAAFPETEAIEHQIIMAQASASAAFTAKSEQKQTDSKSENALQTKPEILQSETLFSLHSRPNLPNAYVAPRHADEQKIAEIWKELLGVKEVGIHDNFFELGGDSLIAVQVLSRLRNTFSIKLTVASLFESPTIAEIAIKLEKPNTKKAKHGREKIEI
ncbi:MULTISPECIES: beta-ketoacyl synthase N-terminal-like domain-containing protein [unclassified Nostoc]|uniref:beta-ketoacyl synthase N-terminal-like domain-containing protein n=1 Tax=unclassified Nostoc TaxID=2593658 RepID=UPI002AD53721|nr:beta-ketoacyl synthase N-terminal-like domain-containing protein [Nostoc sp. DedQUE03]MDZ7974100.1 beta-ketoacyl synthase N-terminal-like domain-containing protein [Nostoc sp. DedQUE03]MDZ8048101.1 beta-ketoacyl synthase N-terminal-like domain-containing protein [Nostoc sp. DedQUE02]